MFKSFRRWVSGTEEWQIHQWEKWSKKSVKSENILRFALIRYMYDKESNLYHYLEAPWDQKTFREALKQQSFTRRWWKDPSRQEEIRASILEIVDSLIQEMKTTPGYSGIDDAKKVMLSGDAHLWMFLCFLLLGMLYGGFEMPYM